MFERSSEIFGAWYFFFFLLQSEIEGLQERKNKKQVVCVGLKKEIFRFRF